MASLFDLFAPASSGFVDPRLQSRVGPGLFDMTLGGPQVEPIRGSLFDPAMMAPMPQVEAGGVAPQPVQRPGLLSRLGGAFFPTPEGMDGLLSPEALGQARRQGLLDIGLSLLANSSPQNGQNAPHTLAAIGQALQAGRQGYLGGVGGAIQGQQMMAQLAQQQRRQAALDAVATKYAPQPDETPEQQRARMAGMVSDLIRIDPSLAGQLNAFAPLFAVPKPTAPEKGILVEEKDGQRLVDPVTGRTIQTFGGKPRPTPEDKPPTQQQELSGGYAARMINAERNVRGLEDAGVTLPDKTLLFPPTSAKGMALYATLTPEQQQLYTFAGDWVAAKLRKESGATISDQEWASEMRRYFRAAGDKQEVAPTKRKLRGVANYGLVQQAGKAYELAPDDAVLVDTGRSTGQKPKAPTLTAADRERAKTDPAFAAWLKSKGVTF